MTEPLEKNVGMDEKHNHKLGPYKTPPRAGITDGELRVSEQGEEMVEVKRRQWGTWETLCYWSGFGERPESERRIVTYGNSIERERISGVSGFSVVEDEAVYFVEYTPASE